MMSRYVHVEDLAVGLPETQNATSRLNPLLPWLPTIIKVEVVQARPRILLSPNSKFFVVDPRVELLKEK